jgi:hypothetical protein
MKKFRSIAVAFAGAAACMIAAAAPGREAITTSQIADAVRQAGMPVTAEQVTLLSHVTAIDAEPLLKVESMEPIGNREMRVRLNCTKRAECLPFYAVIRSSDTSAQQVQASLREPVMPASSQTEPANEHSGSVAIRSGSPATLLIDGGRVHIRVAVVSLENGSIGQTIRVVSKDHTTTYTAEVESATTLRGQL